MILLCVEHEISSELIRLSVFRYDNSLMICLDPAPARFCYSYAEKSSIFILLQKQTLIASIYIIHFVIMLTHSLAHSKKYEKKMKQRSLTCFVLGRMKMGSHLLKMSSIPFIIFSKMNAN